LNGVTPRSRAWRPDGRRAPGSRASPRPLRQPARNRSRRGPFQGLGRQKLQLSQAPDAAVRMEGSAAPDTRCCRSGASRAIPFPRVETMFSSLCGAICRRKANPVLRSRMGAPQSRRQERRGSRGLQSAFPTAPSSNAQDVALATAGRQRRRRGERLRPNQTTGGSFHGRGVRTTAEH
jgi:hypothetical protein